MQIKAGFITDNIFKIEYFFHKTIFWCAYHGHEWQMSPAVIIIVKIKFHSFINNYTNAKVQE